MAQKISSPRKDWVITIDGPSGSGKSTAARLLAKRLGYLYLDTGAMYRAVALKALRKGLSLSDARALTKLAQRSAIVLRPPLSGPIRVRLDGRDVTRSIRKPEVSAAASFVATIPGVRRALVRQQRAIGVRGRIVAEGRDTGTVVFPRADLKVFLTATASHRARRRFEELRAVRRGVRFNQVFQEIKKRDQRDEERTASPLRQARGAIRLDNSRLQAWEVVAKIMDYVRERKRRCFPR